MRFQVPLFIVFLLLLSGCSRKISEFSLLSTEEVDAARLSTLERGTEKIKVKTVSFIPLVIPTGFIREDDAVRVALVNTPGAVALTDVTIRYTWFSIGIYSETGYIVEGIPLIDPEIDTSAYPSVGAGYQVVGLNEKGETVRASSFISSGFGKRKKAKMRKPTVLGGRLKKID